MYYCYINKYDLLIILQLKLGCKYLSQYIYDIYIQFHKEYLSNESVLYYNKLINTFTNKNGIFKYLTSSKIDEDLLYIQDGYSINKVRHNKRNLNYNIKLLSSDTFIQGIDSCTINEHDYQPSYVGINTYNKHRLIYSWGIENQYKLKKTTIFKKVKAINKFLEYYVTVYTRNEYLSNKDDIINGQVCLQQSKNQYNLLCFGSTTLYKYFRQNLNPLFGFIIDDFDNIYWSWDD
ncbi:MAG: hypothetical protein CMG46_02325 [Candidatus Marinimicrobia bacterium]|nr:hypothetical protein [Candidatus Neomarinimicrobiota bacterium]